MSSSDASQGLLIWGVKASLLQYIQRMPDGAVDVDPPAVAMGNTHDFSFPLAEQSAQDRLRFSGGLRCSGHGGLLRIDIVDPELAAEDSADPLAGSWLLTIADPYAPGSRLPFATIGRMRASALHTLTASDTRLTEDGADLFYAGPYTAGTLLDDPVVQGVQ